MKGERDHIELDLVSGHNIPCTLIGCTAHWRDSDCETHYGTCTLDHIHCESL